MKLVKLQIEEVHSLEEFVQFWKQYYNYPNDIKYYNNINKNEHDEDVDLVQSD